MRILYQLTSPMDKTIGSQEVRRRQQVIQDYAAGGTAVVAEPTAAGPAAIENARDAAIVVPELLRLGPAAQERGFDAMIIGCYSDPGIEALQEILRIPVVGPGAASLHVAAQLGTRISVLTPAGRGFGRLAARLRALALEPLLASVRPVGLSVMDLAQQRSGAVDKATEAAHDAVEQDGADVLVLGCMSMAFLPRICEVLTDRAGVPVVNPVTAALKTAEMLVTIGLSQSKVAYAEPGAAAATPPRPRVVGEHA